MFDAVTVLAGEALDGELASDEAEPEDLETGFRWTPMDYTWLFFTNVWGRHWARKGGHMEQVFGLRTYGDFSRRTTSSIRGAVADVGFPQQLEGFLPTAITPRWPRHVEQMNHATRTQGGSPRTSPADGCLTPAVSP